MNEFQKTVKSRMGFICGSVNVGCSVYSALMHEPLCAAVTACVAVLILGDWFVDSLRALGEP